MPKPVPVLYLDLDGTVRQGKDDALGRFVNGPDDVIVFPEAIWQMQRWRRRGGRIVGVTNQGGVSLGFLSQQDCMMAIVETQQQTGSLFDKINVCFHHPQAKDPEWARCWCRKPCPGAIVEAAHSLSNMHPDEMYPPHLALFVGDRPEDKACAESASIDFMWASEWRAESTAGVTNEDHG